MSRPMVFEFVGDETGITKATSAVVTQLEEVEQALAEVEESGRKAGEETVASFLRTRLEAGDTADEIASVLRDGFKIAADEAEVLAREMKTAFDKSERAAEITGREIGDGLGDGFEDGGDAAKDFERDADRSLEDTKREVSRAGKDIGDDLDDGFSKGGNAAKDLKSRAGDAISDIVSDAANGGDNIGENLARGFTSAASVIPGVGAGIGAVIGSLATAAFSSWSEAAEKTEQRTQDMYDDMIESGEAYLSHRFIAAAIEKALGEDVEETQRKADLAGVGIREMARAIAGDTVAMDSVMQSIADKTNDAARAAEVATGAFEKVGGEQARLELLRDEMDGIASSMDTAADRAQAAKDAINEMEYDNPQLKAEVDTDQAQTDLDTLAEGRTTTVTAKPDKDAAQRQLDDLAAQQRTARINVEADTTRFAGALTGVLADRTLTIRTRLLDERGVPVR